MPNSQFQYPIKTSEALLNQYLKVRQHTEAICKNLLTEDYVVQPVDFVSPPKWHLGHTTWFFETMILVPFCAEYKVFDADYNFVFNSYYESIGARVIRTDRGNLSRPSVGDVYKYRQYVDHAMRNFFEDNFSDEALPIALLGINHEQQHQELLFSDIKYILGNNPLLPQYALSTAEKTVPIKTSEWISFTAGIYEIGHNGAGFCFDNECNRHKVYRNEFSISSELVSNQQYLDFINDGGYENFRHWHSEGWDWIKNTQAQAPLYWHKISGQWHHYTFAGLEPVALNQPVTHINFYEAHAFASWSGLRLPLESEWEIAAPKLNWGSRWEWTQSAYLPYPGFAIAPDATGEYNGKFMINQMVLRGASIATPDSHSRITYRNFFHPHLQWQFTGIRLAK